MRVITGGVPDPPGNSVADKMNYIKRHDDQLRKMMLREPRGYPPVCCNLLVHSSHPEADAGFIVMEQTEYPVMSGGNVISVATVLLETGILPMRELVTNLTLEAPAGLIRIKAVCRDQKVVQVIFKNVPSFAACLDEVIEVPGLGQVTLDVGWGGMFYAIADVRQFTGLKLIPEHGAEIARVSSMIRQAANEQLPVFHPDYPGVEVSISQLSGPSSNLEADWKNAVTVSSGPLDWENPATWTGALDRCPCGTGTCAKMAVLYAKGLLPLGKKFRHEGVLGNIFTGELIDEVTLGGKKAVIPTIGGRAWITGFGEYVLDEDDPFPEGFTVRDIWA